MPSTESMHSNGFCSSSIARVTLSMETLVQTRRQSCTLTVCQAQTAEAYPITEKTTLKRYAKRAEYDRKLVHAILDEVKAPAPCTRKLCN